MQWPNTLPQCLEISSYGETFGAGAVRTEMDAGPAFQRPRFTAVVEPISGSITVDAAQYATLKQFWTDTGQGAVPFDWVHPVTQAAALVRFNDRTPPKISAPSGTLFQVAISIEVLP